MSEKCPSGLVTACPSLLQHSMVPSPSNRQALDGPTRKLSRTHAPPPQCREPSPHTAPSLAGSSPQPVCKSQIDAVHSSPSPQRATTSVPGGPQRELTRPSS